MAAGDAALTAIGRWFTIGRIVVGIVGASVSAGAVAFAVADWVSDKAIGGLTTSVQNLQASLNQLSESVRTIDQDIKSEARAWRDDRRDLAKDIAREVALVQTAVDTKQDVQLTEIKSGLDRIEQSIERLRRTSPIRFEVLDTGNYGNTAASAGDWSAAVTKST